MSISFRANKITKEQMKEVFLEGAKNESDFKIGVEVEKLPVKKKSFQAVSYYEKNGVRNFLSEFAKEDSWEQVTQNGHLLGLQKNGNSITLEPGSQFEIALEPKDNIHSCAKYLEQYHKVTGEIASQMDFMWLGYGIQPVSTYHNINVIPKSRYNLMSNYLPSRGLEPLVMMKETAGLQVALDYKNEEDAIKKLRLGLMLSPIISAMFANSPIRAGFKTGYKSFRAHSWLNTDNDRCGLISERLFDKNYEFTFDDYIEILMDVPMIFAERNGEPIPIKGHNFRTYLEDGYEGLEATIEDWNLHSSLFFPDVRMKNFIEFRNADCQNQALSLSIMALYKGIFYNEQAMDETITLFEDMELDWLSINVLRNLIPRLGLEAEHKGQKISTTAIKLIEIAKKSLIEQGKCEEVYLEPLKNYTLKGKTPADVLLDVCGSNIKKLVEFTQII